MFGPRRPAIINAELDGHNTPGDFAVRRVLVYADHDTAQAQLVHRVGDGARVHGIQTSN
jgi:hypothetical protein